MTIRWNSVARGMFKYSAVSTEEIPRVKEIGVRIANKMTKEQSIMAMATEVSGMRVLLSGLRHVF